MNLSSPSVIARQRSCFDSNLKGKNDPNIKFDQNFDETEQRIVEFLDSIGIFYKNPLDKYYDYMDKLREEKNSESLSSSKSIGTSSDEGENGKIEKKTQCFSLSSSLYKKRKIVNHIPNI